MRGRRTPEEDSARSKSRSLCSSLGSKIRKVNNSHVEIAPCKIWPLGVITSYNGWCDALDRVMKCAEDPELVVEGHYFSESDSPIQEY